MKKTKPEFNWDLVAGYTEDKTKKAFLEHEIFTLNCYEHVYPVREGDIVLDLGASIAPFTWKIMDKASKVYIIEPMIDLIPTIEANTRGFNVEIINAALTSDNGAMEFNDGCINEFEPKTVRTLDFKTFIKENKIDKIDFIKTDCEGGEYDLISKANIKWIKENVRNIVGEWHLRTTKPVQPGDPLNVEFRYFRDKFLPQFTNFEVYSVDGHSIKWDLYNEHFLDYYGQVNFHIEV